MNSLETKYRIWKSENERVFDMFERFSLQMLAKKKRFGIAALAERVRWEVNFAGTDEEGFKINNNYVAYIGRDLIAKYPELEPLVATRRVRAA